MKTKLSKCALGLLSFFFVLASRAPARAQDATVKVFESTFNELADKLSPLRMTGHKTFQVCSFLGCVTVCDSDWRADVTNVRFAITTASIGVTGDITANWCGVGFNGHLSTSGNATYNSGQRAVNVTVSHTAIQPCFNIIGINVCLPVWIDVAPALTLPPVPVGIGTFAFETSSGPRTLQVVPSNVSLTKKTNFVELRSDVTLF